MTETAHQGAALPWMVRGCGLRRARPPVVGKQKAQTGLRPQNFECSWKETQLRDLSICQGLMFLGPIFFLFRSQTPPRHCLCLRLSIFWLATHGGGWGAEFPLSG